MKNFYQTIINGAEQRINELNTIIASLPKSVDKTYYMNEIAKSQSIVSKYQAKVS